MKILFAVLACAAWLAAARAEVKPNALFSDGAVLQQGVAVPVWGAANDDEKILVKFQGQEISTTAKNGRWMVRLKPLKAGGPFSLAINGDNSITLTNILVGEVWLCSGQSNMGFKLYRAENGAEAIATAGDAQLRLFSVPHGAADSPQTGVHGELRNAGFPTGETRRLESRRYGDEVHGTWKESTSQTASNFSAVAWFFGRDLRRARKVPIGLIDSSVGGTPAEAWTSRETLAADPELKKILELYADNVQKFDPAKAELQHEAALKKYAEEIKLAEAAGKPAPRAPQKPGNPAKASKRPAGLYNAMIVPLQPYALAGAIWYQGEANSGRAQQYQKLFPALIHNWREAWGQGAFPFLFVQIAPESVSENSDYS